jgi:hypothetical protein
MSSLWGRIAAYADLLAQLKEIEQLRKRVKQAEKLCSIKPNPPKKRPASFHRRAPTSYIH